MYSNLPLSKSDEALLKLIVDDLVQDGSEIKTKNIRQHPLFAKIDQKKFFKDNDCFVQHIGLGLAQKGPDKFSVQLTGTNISLENPIHRKFIEEIFGEVAKKISTFSKVTEILGLSEQPKNPTPKRFEDFLDELREEWKKN